MREEAVSALDIYMMDAEREGKIEVLVEAILNCENAYSLLET